MVKDTSKKAYQVINANGSAVTQRDRILRYLKNNPKQTRREIAVAMGIDISAVAGRVNELLKAGLINEYPRRIDRISGHSAHPVGM